MNRKFLIVMGLAAGIVAVGATASNAEAGRRGHGFHTGWYNGGERHVERRFHRQKRRAHYGFYTPDSFSPTCHHYLKKARWSGHRYWWRKYNRCIRGGY